MMRLTRASSMRLRSDSDSCWSRTVLARLKVLPTEKSSPMAMNAFTHGSTGKNQMPIDVTPTAAANEIQVWAIQAGEWNCDASTFDMVCSLLVGC